MFDIVVFFSMLQMHIPAVVTAINADIVYEMTLQVRLTLTTWSSK